METKNLIAALVKAQLEIVPPSKEGVNPMFKNKYATLDSIYHAIREPLAKNGLSLSHSVEIDEAGRYFLITTLMHVSGELMNNRFPMIVEKQTNQGIASARTYACRYATCNLMALPSDEDDDGNAGSRVTQRREVKVEEPKTLNEDQCKLIEEYVASDQTLSEKILKGYGVKKFSEIEGKHFHPIITNLQKRGQVRA